MIQRRGPFLAGLGLLAFGAALRVFSSSMWFSPGLESVESPLYIRMTALNDIYVIIMQAGFALMFVGWLVRPPPGDAG